MRKSKADIYIYECHSCGQNIVTTNPKRVAIYHSEYGDDYPVCAACKAISDATNRDEKLAENEGWHEDALVHPDTVDAGRSIERVADVDDEEIPTPNQETLAVLGFARELIERDLVKILT